MEYIKTSFLYADMNLCQWLRDSPDGLDSLFDDLDQDFSYDNPYNPAGPKNKEPPTANQPQLERCG